MLINLRIINYERFILINQTVASTPLSGSAVAWTVCLAPVLTLQRMLIISFKPQRLSLPRVPLPPPSTACVNLSILYTDCAINPHWWTCSVCGVYGSTNSCVWLYSSGSNLRMTTHALTSSCSLNFSMLSLAYTNDAPRYKPAERSAIFDVLLLPIYQSTEELNMNTETALSNLYWSLWNP